MTATQSRPLNVTNIHGTNRVPFRICRSTHGKGYMGIIPSSIENYMHWIDLMHVNNITYSATFYDSGPATSRSGTANKAIQWSHEIQRIDYTSGLGTETEVYPAPSAGHGNKAYYYGNDTLTNGVEKSRLAILVEHPNCGVTGSPDAAQPNQYCDTSYNLRTYKCFWENCIPPPTLPPTISPNQNDCRWSDPTCWENGMPPVGANVTIKQEYRMIIDVQDIDVDLIFVEGGLVFDQTTNVNYNFNARQLISNTGGGGHEDQIGRSIRDSMENVYSSIGRNTGERGFTMMSDSLISIGTEAEPWPCEGQVRITLTGDKWSKEIGSPNSAVVIGAKAIAALGGLEIHGCPVTLKHTNLKTAVNPGDLEITVVDDVSAEWKVGNRIFIGPSSYDMRESEEFLIIAINGARITLDRAVQFFHNGADESTTTDYQGDFGTVHFGAEVGLLSRNVQIDGSDQSEGIFGGRVVVMRSSSGDTHRYGHAQISNVEFSHMGQFGYQEEEDRRGAIFLWGLEDASISAPEYNLKNSYIKDCAFHSLYNSAIGTAHTRNFEVSGNVIHNVVNDAIILNGASGVTVKNNLISRVVYSNLHVGHDQGSFAGAQLAEDEVPAGIFLDRQPAQLSGNIIAGSDGACFEHLGEPCSAADQCHGTQTAANPLFANNRGHACLRGIHFKSGAGGCNRFSGYTLYKNIDFGMFLHSSGMIIVEKSLLVNNFNGMLTWTFGSSPISHNLDNKHVTYKGLTIDQHFAGDFRCAEYNIRKNALIVTSGQTRNSRLGWTTSEGGGFGMISPDNTEKSHKWPVKQITFAESYASILGGSCIHNTKFMNFGKNCGNVGHVAISGNDKWVDHHHKVELNGCTYHGDAGYEYFFSRPHLKDINLASCVDMDCDGLKRQMIIDVDGSFTGAPMTTLVAQSEFHYERWVQQPPHYYQGPSNVPNNEDFPQSSPQRGIGDFRIPKSMVTRLDGSRIPYPDYAPRVGTLRDFGGCAWEPKQNGYKCNGNNKRYATLMFESFDHDSSTRRVAPIGMRKNEDGMIDLSNGVIDHSCCFGYSCQLRLTQNYFNVECGKTYEFHTTGTVPKHTRFHLLGLNTAADDCQIRVDMFTFRQNRQNIFLNDQYVMSNQMEMINGEESWKFPDDSMKPDVTEPAGANYFQRLEQVVYFNIDANSYVDVKIANTVLLELEIVTEFTIDEFWDSTDLPRLLAVMLNIDQSKVKLMKVVSEQTGRSLTEETVHHIPEHMRKREPKANKVKTVGADRSDSCTDARAKGIFVQFEIGNSGDSNAGRTSGNADLEFAADVAGKLLDALDNGDIGDALGNCVGSLSMAVPPPDAVAPDWYDAENDMPKPGATIADEVGYDDPDAVNLEDIEAAIEANFGSLDEVETYEKVQEKAEEVIDASDDLITYKANNDPASIGYYVEGGAILPQAGVPINPPIVVLAYNAEGDVISGPVVNPLDPWIVTAFLANNTDDSVNSTNVLEGDVTCAFNALGQCIFDNLIISGTTDGVKLFFAVTSQPGEDDDIEIDDTETDDIIVTASTTPIPPTTKGSTVTTTTDPSTSVKPTDMPCIIQGKKGIKCGNRNLFTGKPLAEALMNLSVKPKFYNLISSPV
jgi:hypothetical protein